MTIRLVINALAYTLKKARLATTGGSDLEHNEGAGQVSTILRLLSSKDGDPSYCIDKIFENQIDNTSLKQKLFNNRGTLNAKKGKLKGQLPLEFLFGFSKTFKMITKN